MTTAPSPMERYSLTSCNLLRTFPSLGEASYTGALTSPHPELLKCDPSGGVSVEIDLIPQDSTEEEAKPQPLLLESQATLADLQKHLIESNNTSGLTVAVWFTPALTLRGQSQPIFTIGGKERPDQTHEYYKGPGCPGYDFSIAQFEKNILLSYAGGDQNSPCSYARVATPLTEAVPTHVAVTIGSRYTNIYLNGKAMVVGITNKFNTTLQHWNTTASSLQLFTAYSSDYVFHGAIHQVDLFDQFLDASQVSAVYQEGIVHVPPSEITVAAKVDEVRIRQHATEPVSLHLGSWNTTSTVFRLEVELLSLPQNGVLTLDSALVAAKSRFPVAMDASSIALDYNPKSTDYFNVPSVTAYDEDLRLGSESFTFRVLGFNVKNELLATSPTVTQYVHVVHVNHAGVLSVPEGAVLDAYDPTMATVTGIDFADPLDYNMDRVRVDLWAEHGELSLLSAYLPLADFDSCRHRSSGWQCAGDGVRDQNMTFVAIPSDIPFILRNLGYQSSSLPGTADEISIRVSDGSGGACLDEAEHAQYEDVFGNNYTSVRDNCFQMQGIVRVPGHEIVNPASPNIRKGSRGGIPGLGFLSTADLLFWALVFAIVACCGLGCRRLPRCLARGKTIEADDNSVSENVCEETDPAAEAV